MWSQNQHVPPHGGRSGREGKAERERRRAGLIRARGGGSGRAARPRHGKAWRFLGGMDCQAKAEGVHGQRPDRGDRGSVRDAGPKAPGKTPALRSRPPGVSSPRQAGRRAARARGALRYSAHARDAGAGPGARRPTLGALPESIFRTTPYAGQCGRRTRPRRAAKRAGGTSGSGTRGTARTPRGAPIPSSFAAGGGRFRTRAAHPGSWRALARSLAPPRKARRRRPGGPSRIAAGPPRSSPAAARGSATAGPRERSAARPGSGRGRRPRASGGSRAGRGARGRAASPGGPAAGCGGGCPRSRRSPPGGPPSGAVRAAARATSSTRREGAIRRRGSSTGTAAIAPANPRTQSPRRLPPWRLPARCPRPWERGRARGENQARGGHTDFGTPHTLRDWLLFKYRRNAVCA